MASTGENRNFDTDKKEVYYLRLHLLVMKCGTRILKSTFDNKIPNRHIRKKLLKKLKNEKRDNGQAHNRDLLYLRTGEDPNSEDYDISSLVFLLKQNGCLNKREEEDIGRLRKLRNKLCHLKLPELEEDEFETMWSQAEEAMLRLASKCNIRDFKTEIEKAKRKLISNEFRCLRESTHQFFCEFDDDIYVDTSAFKTAKELLDKHHFVVLSGHRGEGKTSMAARLALSISFPIRCLLLHKPSNWYEVDLSSKLTRTIIIDDLYGSAALDQRSVAEWSKHLKDMRKAASDGRIYVIITCVTYVLNQSDEEIGAIRNLIDKSELSICELTSSKLTQTEKCNILQALATNSSRDISQEKILECVHQSSCEKESFLCGFPQQASAFCKNGSLYRMESYFKAPSECFLTYLKHMYRRGGENEENDKFVAFLLLWGKKDKTLHRSELEVTTASKHVKHILKVFGRPLDNTVVTTMLLSLKSHVGGFLKYNRRTGEFMFNHSTICDAIGLAFGRKEPAKLLQICVRDFFMQYITVVGFDETPDLCKIVYEDDMFPELAEKCCLQILEGDTSVSDDEEYSSLARYGKHGNTLYISELIDCGIIKHHAFSSSTFVDVFLKYVKSNRLVGKVFSRLVLSMSGRFLDYAIAVERLDMYLLDYALFSGADKFAEAVLSSGIVDAKRVDLEMSLLLAIHSKKIRLIQLLLDRGARVTSDALHVAIRRSRTVLDMLLRQPGINVNEKGRAVNGNYPLIIAASKSNYHAVKRLLSYGADPAVRNTMNITALYKAILLSKADNKRDEIINILIKHGSPLDVRGGERKRTPLHIAVDLGETALVQTLLRHGASLYVSDKTGQFPLHTAVMQGHVGIVPLLLKSDRSLETQRMTLNRHQGSKWKRKDVMRGMSVFHTAINNIWKQGRHEMVDALISVSADPNVKDCYGRTPLLYAIERKHTDVVLQLMRYFKVNKKLADKRGRTPLHVALQNDLNYIAKKLIPDSDINAKDKYGETGLHIACTKLNISAIDCLMRYAADFTMVKHNGDTVFHILTKRHEEIADHVVQFFLQLDPKLVDALPHLQNNAGQTLNVTLIDTELRRIESLSEYLQQKKIRHTANMPPHRRLVVVANMSRRRKRVETDNSLIGQSVAKRLMNLK